MVFGMKKIARRSICIAAGVAACALACAVALAASALPAVATERTFAAERTFIEETFEAAPQAAEGAERTFAVEASAEPSGFAAEGSKEGRAPVAQAKRARAAFGVSGSQQAFARRPGEIRPVCLAKFVSS